MLQIYLDSSNCKPGEEEQTGAGTEQNKFCAGAPSLGQFVEPVLCGPCATQAFVFSGMKCSLNSCFTYYGGNIYTCGIRGSKEIEGPNR